MSHGIVIGSMRMQNHQTEYVQCYDGINTVVTDRRARIEIADVIQYTIPGNRLVGGQRANFAITLYSSGSNDEE